MHTHLCHVCYVQGKGCAQSHKAAIRCLEYASYFGGPRAWMEYAEVRYAPSLWQLTPARLSKSPKSSRAGCGGLIAR